MSKEELIQFLKDNLKITIRHDREYNYLKTRVELYLCDDEISFDTCSESVETW